MQKKQLSYLFALCFQLIFTGCAGGLAEDPESVAADPIGLQEQEIFVAKSEFGRVGAELALQAVELLPGETVEAAARRVFGTGVGYDIQALLDSTARPPNGGQQPSNPGGPAGGGVCVDSCRYANDNECDDPGLCAAGTDCSDCGGAQQGNSGQPGSQGGPSAPQGAPSGGSDSCRYANDNECDEPVICPAGTDTSDCRNAGGNQPGASPQPGAPQQPQGQPSGGADSCRYANDNECDEPTYCAVGTDTSDCRNAGGQSGQPGASPQPGAPQQPQGQPSGGADSCRYANDNECDEPTYCAVGTDTSDCRNAGGQSGQPGASPQPGAPQQPQGQPSGGADSCRYANDNECDEPVICPAGTDTSDCRNAGGSQPGASPQPGAPQQPQGQPAGGADSCRYANDNECDEPTYCPAGTDTSDCRNAGGQSGRPGGSSQPGAPQQPQGQPSGGADSCRYANDNECDEPLLCPTGTDTSDCRFGGGASGSRPQGQPPASSGQPSGGADSCRYANDNECDEPTICPLGTDTSDCRFGGGASGSGQPPASSGQPSGGPDSCRYANDNECDEPTICPLGTDTSDCRFGGGASGSGQPPASSGPPSGGPDSCRYANDNECDEPVICPLGTDTSDCRFGGGAASSPAPSAPAAPATCNYTNDNECDEPLLCPVGTDTADCSVQFTNKSSHQAHVNQSTALCFARGQEGTCVDAGACAGTAVPGVCPDKVGSTCCLKESVDFSKDNKPGVGQACKADDFEGICVGQGTCGGDGVSGVCGQSWECCAQNQFQRKFVVTVPVVVAGGTKLAIFAYKAYRAYRVMNTAVGVVRMLNAQGQQVQVGLKTDAESVATARRAAPTGVAPTGQGQVVGSVSANYFNERAAESSNASDDVQICSDAHKAQLQRQIHDVCDREGYGNGACRQRPPGQDMASYCAEIRRKHQGAQHCVNLRKRVRDECFGGLGHADRNGERTENDEAINQATNRLRTCLQKINECTQQGF